MTGNDVIIAQNLLIRSSAVTKFQPNGVFDESSKLATSQFQEENKLPSTGIFDDATAKLLLDLHSADGHSYPSLTPLTLFRR